MKNILINELSVRDGNQSLMATRMPIDDIVSLVTELDKVGFNALEVWGGATFDVCLRFLDEDPWQRLREIRKTVKNTKLSMLLRGQNLIGYTHYSDDVVDKFIEKAIHNGIDIIRVFDALNDLDNIRQAVYSCKRYHGHCQCAIAYTTSPVHSIEYFVEIAKEMVSLGADSLCIKDMAGILLPNDAYKLVKEIKSVCDVPVAIHSHATSGISSLMIIKAIEAGVDIVDTCVAPFSQGTSHMASETLVTMLQQSLYDHGLDQKALQTASNLATQMIDKYINKGLVPTKALQINPDILEYQVPGGMLSNLMSQLEMQNASDRYQEVLQEIPLVRKDLGYPPLVTPLSQMVGSQAVMNILSGSRYSIISNEVKEYIAGKYGKPVSEIAPFLVELVLNGQKPITVRPADLLEPSFEKTKSELIEQGYELSEEQILSYIIFPQFALKSIDNNEEEFISFNVYFKEN